MWTSTIFGAKTSEFSKFMVCPHGQGGESGLSQCRNFANKEVNFSRYCTDVF